MNTYRKLKKNSKALSPVVASIILIAVTVAVSVVVAAWMSGSIFNLMGTTEQATVTNVQLLPAATTVTISLQNTGNSPITVNSASINGHISVITQYSINSTAAVSGSTVTFGKSDSNVQVAITVPSGMTLTSGENYRVSYICMVLVLVIVVANNIIVIINTLQ